VSGGLNHLLATKVNGALYAWGYSNNGQLGNNTVVAKSSPIQVGALTTWEIPVAAEVFSIAIKNDGTLWTWGRNNNGQLGHNNIIDRSSPVQIGTSSDWSIASGGENHVIAVKANGTLWAWGANSNGNLGDGTISAKSSPVQIGALTTWQNVSASRSGSSVAVKTDGTLWAWGRNSNGQLGDGTVVSKSSPVQIGSASTWVNVSTGQTHVLALYGVV
jgi:alpha-tubulin suppressor-like RCC1 family protein